ncbi:MAG: hypothetical protein L0Z50_40255 [Verrucomicrobiales bacterium]|nr:hypothetical protein [Verrucomicrobiales bacterium]
MNIKTFAITAFLIVVACTLVRAFSMHMTIHSPKQCPEGLTIKSKVTQRHD